MRAVSLECNKFVNDEVLVLVSVLFCSCNFVRTDTVRVYMIVGRRIIDCSTIEFRPSSLYSATTTVRSTPAILVQTLHAISRRHPHRQKQSATVGC